MFMLLEASANAFFSHGLRPRLSLRTGGVVIYSPVASLEMSMLAVPCNESVERFVVFALPDLYVLLCCLWLFVLR